MLILNGKKEKTLNTSILYPDAENRLIYINENMTKYYRMLLKKARDLKRNGTVNFAWFKIGKVLIRKTEKSKVIYLQ